MKISLHLELISKYINGYVHYHESEKNTFFSKFSEEIEILIVRKLKEIQRVMCPVLIRMHPRKNISGLHQSLH